MYTGYHFSILVHINLVQILTLNPHPKNHGKADPHVYSKQLAHFNTNTYLFCNCNYPSLSWSHHLHVQVIGLQFVHVMKQLTTTASEECRTESHKIEKMPHSLNGKHPSATKFKNFVNISSLPAFSNMSITAA